MSRIVSQLSGFSKQDLDLHNFRASGYGSLNTGEVMLRNNAQYGAGSPSENTANPLNIKQLQRYNSFRKQTTVTLNNFSRKAKLNQRDWRSQQEVKPRLAQLYQAALAL